MPSLLAVLVTMCCTVPSSAQLAQPRYQWGRSERFGGEPLNTSNANEVAYCRDEHVCDHPDAASRNQAELNAQAKMRERGGWLKVEASRKGSPFYYHDHASAFEQVWPKLNRPSLAARRPTPRRPTLTDPPLAAPSLW